jgi:hypothetical protein
MYKELPLCRQPDQQDNAQHRDADNHPQDVDSELKVLSSFITPLWNAHAAKLILAGPEQRT